MHVIASKGDYYKLIVGKQTTSHRFLSTPHIEPKNYYKNVY